jgi:CMP/dCMP kinase
MIITLAGLPGSGKSTVKNILANRLGWKAYSMGDMRGAYAQERGITIDELNTLGMTDPRTDAFVDEFQTELGKKEDSFIIDGRVSWHFIPQSIKVFLTLTPEESARRIFADRQAHPHRRADEPRYQTVEETQRILEERVSHDQARYRKWYGVDFLDLSQYDLVIDTTALSPEEVAHRILAFTQSRA